MGPRWSFGFISRKARNCAGSAIALRSRPRILLIGIERLLEDAIHAVLERHGFEVCRRLGPHEDLAAAVDETVADALLVGCDGRAARQVWSLLARREDLRAIVVAGDGTLLLLPVGEASPPAIVQALTRILGADHAP